MASDRYSEIQGSRLGNIGNILDAASRAAAATCRGRTGVYLTVVSSRERRIKIAVLSTLKVMFVCRYAEDVDTWLTARGSATGGTGGRVPLNPGGRWEYPPNNLKKFHFILFLLYFYMCFWPFSENRGPNPRQSGKLFNFR